MKRPVLKLTGFGVIAGLVLVACNPPDQNVYVWDPETGDTKPVGDTDIDPDVFGFEDEDDMINELNSWFEAIGLTDDDAEGAYNVYGDFNAITASDEPYGDFPVIGDEYLIMSTGDAEEVIGGEPEDHLSTELEYAPPGIDGEDLTQIRIQLTPPEDAMCLAFDYAFLTEEDPGEDGTEFNDIFTAEMYSELDGQELNGPRFHMTGDQVHAPYNFAWEDDDNYVSVNTLSNLEDITEGTGMDRGTELMTALTTVPLNPTQDEREARGRNIDLILSIQDIGSSEDDSAVLLDNFRWGYDGDDLCEGADIAMLDSDGDALPDLWETEGIDITGDGSPDLDLAALGADPERADIFVQIDWFDKGESCDPAEEVCTTRPSMESLRQAVRMFDTAPFTAPNGSQGINLHIDAGPESRIFSAEEANDDELWEEVLADWEDLEGHPWPADDMVGFFSRTEEVEVDRDSPDHPIHDDRCRNVAYNWEDFQNHKDQSFDDFRHDAFHYSLHVPQLGQCDPGGISRGNPSSDFISVAPEWALRSAPVDDLAVLANEVGIFVHELGHNLGLMHMAHHHGNTTNRWNAHEAHVSADRTFYSSDYVSPMSYYYQSHGITRDPDKSNYAPCRGTELQETHELDPKETTVAEVLAEDPTFFDGCFSYAESWPEASDSSQGDWDNLIFYGGAIGDRGDLELPDTTVTEPGHEEKTFREMVAEDPNPRDGQGLVELFDPNVIEAEAEEQPMVAGVENISSVTSDYTVTVETEDGQVLGEGSVTVAADSTETVEVTLDASDLPEGEHTVTVTLFSEVHSGDVFSSQHGIRAADLSDSETVQGYQASLADFRDQGYDVPEEAEALFEERLSAAEQRIAEAEAEEAEDNDDAADSDTGTDADAATTASDEPPAAFPGTAILVVMLGGISLLAFIIIAVLLVRNHRRA